MEVPSSTLSVDDGAVVKVCAVVVVFISVDMQLHQCIVTGVWSLLNRDIVAVEGIVKSVFIARICKRLWSPGIDSASLCSLVMVGRYDQ
jgi:hypothetical protein